MSVRNCRWTVRGATDVLLYRFDATDTDLLTTDEGNPVSWVQLEVAGGSCGPVFFKCDVIDGALSCEVTIGECQEGVGDAIFATGTADVRARRMCGTGTSDDVDMNLAMPVPSLCTRKELRKKRHPHCGLSTGTMRRSLMFFS